MGQRLVITIHEPRNFDDICKAYYHWSAYTESAMQEVNRICTFYADIRNNEENKHHSNEWCLIQALYKNGSVEYYEDGSVIANDHAGMRVDETPEGLNRFCGEPCTFVEVTDRSEGIIAVSKKGMEELQDWSEGNIDLVLHENGEIELFDFDVYWDEPLEDYCDMQGFDEEERLSDNDIKFIKDCLEKKDFDNESLKELLDKCNLGVIEGNGIDKNKFIVEFDTTSREFILNPIQLSKKVIDGWNLIELDSLAEDLTVFELIA